MRRSRKQLEAVLQKKAEIAIQQLLDWNDRNTEPTLTVYWSPKVGHFLALPQGDI